MAEIMCYRTDNNICILESVNKTYSRPYCLFEITSNESNNITCKIRHANYDVNKVILKYFVLEKITDNLMMIINYSLLDIQQDMGIQEAIVCFCNDEINKRKTK